ncbi:unnamed protein product [Caenorhabditis angaria]|uniref:Uncharacterized protein n=1 Tax=Caenorhabditis angaria TaxID=860376 RepID=A0A9P1IMA9_9PELO|nr:unnamed protein product [Caenorhabditis angaria]
MYGERFRGKVALITGSTSGIGQAAAALFAGQGAKVVITGRSEEGAKLTRQLCLEAGALPWHVTEILGDIMDEKFIDKLIDETIKKFGKLNILVNNAGTLELDPTGAQGWDMSVEVMDRSMNSNFRSVLLLTKKAIKHLVEQKGDIVNVSTFLTTPTMGIMSMPYYGVPKAALDQMSRSMAHEYVLKGVRVNTVNPGLVATSFFARLGVGNEKARKMEQYIASHPEYIPLGKVASSEDVAKTIAFLADRNQSECIVGQSIYIDGGSRLCCNIDMSDFKEHM